MARYGRDFDAYRGYRRDRGGQWNQGGAWQGYDADFNRGRFQQQGGRFGTGAGGYGSGAYARGQYGGRGFARRYDEESYGMRNRYDQGNYGRTDFGNRGTGGMWGGGAGRGDAGYTGDDFMNAGTQTRRGRMFVIMIGPNGLTLDPEGRLVYAAPPDRAIMRLEADGTRTVVAVTTDSRASAAMLFPCSCRLSE